VVGYWASSGVVLAQTASKPELYVQSGAPGMLSALAFSSDGRYLAGKTGGTILIWDVEKGMELRRMESHFKGDSPLALSRDAKFLATAGEDGGIELWDVALGMVLGKPVASTKSIFSVAFSPDGRFLVGSHVDTITLWETAGDGREVSMSDAGERVASVAVSPDNRFVASISKENIKLWDIESKKPVKTFSAKNAEDLTESLLFAADGRLLALSRGLGASLWEVENPKKILSLLWFEAVGVPVAVNPRNEILALGHPNSSFVALLDWKNRKCIRSFDATANKITGLAFTSDGKSMFLGYDKGEIRQVDLTSGRILRALNGVPSDGQDLRGL
jgi:WD40 repeat protein